MMSPEKRSLIQHADQASKRARKFEQALRQIAESARQIALEALGAPCKACGEPVTTEHAQAEVVQCGDLNGTYHDVCKPTPDQYREHSEANRAA